MALEEYKQFISQQWVVFVGFLIVGLLLYGNTFSNEFIWDDYEGVVYNDYIKDRSHFPEYFTQSLVSGAGMENNYWRPLVLFSFYADYKLGELDVFWYHLQNIFWHILATSLVYVFLREISLQKWKAFLVALLFLIHPLQTEAVTYISGRADMMFGFFVLLSLIGAVKYIKTDSYRKYLYYLGSVICFGLALLAKERGILVLPLVAGYFFLLTDFAWRRKFFLISPFVAIGVGYLVLRATVLHFVSDFNTVIVGGVDFQTLNILQQATLYLKVIGLYFWLIFVPIKLHMIRVVNLEGGFWNGYVIIGGIVVMMIVLSGVYFLKKNRRREVFFLYWILITLFPSFYTFKMQGYVGEHWLYLVLPGVFVFLVEGYEWILKKWCSKVICKRMVVILGVCFLALLSGGTVKRNKEWARAIDFYEINIKRGGASAVIYNNLGIAYAKESEYDKSLMMYSKALGLNDKMCKAWYNEGNVYYKLKQYDQAEEVFKRSLECDGGFLPAYHNLALVYLDVGKRREAISFLRDVEYRFREETILNYDLALLYFLENNFEEAEKYVKRVLEIDSNNVQGKKLLRAIMLVGR